MSNTTSPAKKKKKTASRKKTTRACNHCHKAHMTCDETRPCKRCYQRGLDATCVDAPRKKKKYLMDVPDNLTKPPGYVSQEDSSTTTTSQGTPLQPQIAHTHHVTLPSLPAVMGSVKHEQSLPLLNDLYPPQLSMNKPINHPSHSPPQAQYVPHLNQSFTHSNQRTKFMSNAANSEYSILSDIIRQDDMGLGIQQRQSHSFSEQHHDYAIHRKNSSAGASTSGSTPTPLTQQPQDLYASYKQGDKAINQYMLGFVQDKVVTLPEVLKSIDGERQFETEKNHSSVLSFSISINEQTADNGPSTASFNSQSPWGLRFKEAEDIYAKVSTPFSYTPGFHALIQYLKHRFARNELIQMAKAMASYRPSFIACTNTLKEEDLIFMEQCFQRTLLEYDKFISLSGTPTIVWRRTGQIAYVSEEFCILTGWTREQLLQKITFIVELMDDVSVLEYFNLFSTIAYGDFRGATMGGCTLLTPEHTRIKTTCMWTLKRDVFGIPMMIIGNFLPVV